MAKTRKSKPAASSAKPTAVAAKPVAQPPRAAPPRPPSPGSEEDMDDEKPVAKRQPFRFFDLPSELRLRIYEEVFRVTERHVMELYEGKQRANNIAGLDGRPDPPLDLEPNVNWFLIRPRLNLLKVSHRMHDEAYRVFYSQPMRLYPHHDRFFYTKQPLLARIPPKYRNMINTLELRLGKGWSKIPRCQNTDPSLGLSDCTSLKVLKIFVQCDPSDSHFNGFRGKNANEDTYKWFCIDLLRGILQQVPRLKVVEIDAYPGIKQSAPLITGLREIVQDAGKKLVWGPLRGWESESGLNDLQKAMAGMGLTSGPRVVEVQA